MAVHRVWDVQVVLGGEAEGSPAREQGTVATTTEAALWQGKATFPSFHTCGLNWCLCHGWASGSGGSQMNQQLLWTLGIIGIVFSWCAEQVHMGTRNSAFEKLVSHSETRSCNHFAWESGYARQFESSENPNCCARLWGFADGILTLYTMTNEEDCSQVTLLISTHKKQPNERNHVLKYSA